METIKIVTRDLDIGQDIKDYIDKKFGKLERYIPKVSSTEVTLRKEKYIYNVDVLIHTYHKKIIKLSTKDKNLRSAIDTAVGKIKEMLIKYKEKTIVSNKKHSKVKKDNLIENLSSQQETYRKDKMILEEMTERQAIEKLSSTDDNFLLFFNTDTNTVSLARKNAENLEIIDIIYRKE